jgi:thermostable 8-oxoguanine DNA glycosylase
MQQVISRANNELRFLDLPDPEFELMPAVAWGRHEEALTPAFWVATAWQWDFPAQPQFQLGRTLAEEVAVCILGGYGLPAEVGLAAFDRVAARLRADSQIALPDEAELLEMLSVPLNIRGRRIRYRFAKQRSRYLARALERVNLIDEDTLNDIGLRTALCDLPGIGPKTASWIVRNRRASDEVAILDVHIVRACQIMGVFPERSDPARSYARLESLFLEFCRGVGVRASVMDAVMWATMRNLSKKLLRFLLDQPPSIGGCLQAQEQGLQICLAQGARETMTR